MRVVLRSDVDDLGKKGDLIEVADGYARNYLVPEGLAIKAAEINPPLGGRDREAVVAIAPEDVVVIAG